jgi:hypothetical protein
MFMNGANVGGGSLNTLAQSQSTPDQSMSTPWKSLSIPSQSLSKPLQSLSTPSQSQSMRSQSLSMALSMPLQGLSTIRFVQKKPNKNAPCIMPPCQTMSRDKNFWVARNFQSRNHENKISLCECFFASHFMWVLVRRIAKSPEKKREESCLL